MQGKRIAGLLAAGLCWLSVAAPATALTAVEGFAADDPPARVPDQVIVQFDRESSATARSDAREDAGTDSLEGLGSPGLKLVEITDGGSIAATIRELEADPAVELAEPNVIEHPSAAPNDPDFPQLWGLLNAGQTVNGTAGTADADIDAPEAWDIGTGSTDTVVAVIDSGIDPTHPDLADNLWQNPGEVASNGVDDDANGFVDDVNGYDFVGAEDPDPLDAVGHGTHVSGTIAATGNNGTGVTGVSQRASIMALRVCSVSGCAVADQTQAINYAAANGARVLNASLGGFSATESASRRAAIFSHPEVLHVFAAGNEGTSADDSPAECDGASPCISYPCAHAPQGSEIDNVICVAATTQTDAKAGFSNFGGTSVDLGAPGTNVLSSNAERSYLNDPLTAATFAANWNQNGADTNWTQTSEAPLSAGNQGITDSVGGNYLPSTNYGTFTDVIPVGAVAERGCFVTLSRSIALAAGDFFRVALFHDGTGQQYSFTELSNSGGALQSRTLDYTPSLAGGNLQVLLRLQTDAATQANGVHVGNVALECGETPGPHNFDFKQGTSMASPVVAGAAALLISRNPGAPTSEIREKLLSTVDSNAALTGVTTTGGRLNVGTAMSRMSADTTITGGPGEGEEIGARTTRGTVVAPGAKPTFSFSSNDPAAGFQCSVDGANFASCASGQPLGPLGPGPHGIAVRSVDPRGNADATPATRSFAVESDPPETKIKKGPKKRTSSRKAKLKFTSDEPGSTFECKLDKKKFKPCRSPRKLKKLDPKRHKFLVRAVDAVGNVDATPAKKRWRVKR